MIRKALLGLVAGVVTLLLFASPASAQPSLSFQQPTILTGFTFNPSATPPIHAFLEINPHIQQLPSFSVPFPSNPFIGGGFALGNTDSVGG